jgi:citrate lyase subunit beta/citryl-CoA lyase
MRSLLFVPGDSPRKLERGAASDVDVLILDLEDSVAPDAKARARETTAAFLREHGAGRSWLAYVRVNDLGSGLAEDDLATVMAGRPDGIMLPKAGSLADAERLSAMLRVQEAVNGQDDGVTRILPLITETPAALLSVQSWIAGHARLSGLTWGAEDLSAAIGASSARDAAGRLTGVFAHARTATILAAAAANVPAVDTVYTDFRDPDGLRRECEEAERDGFTAKLAIHPDQVTVINEAFTPGETALKAARDLVEAFRAAGDPGVVGIDGKMYDRPHLERARRLLARARS